MNFNSTLIDREVLVFRSNIDMDQKAAMVCVALKKIKGVQRVNIDLEDWENVLRIECDRYFPVGKIKEKVTQLGFECTELSDDSVAYNKRISATKINNNH